MPLYGRRNTDELMEHGAAMSGMDAEPLELQRAEVLQAMFEIADSGMQNSLPRALHPTIPPTVNFVLWRCSQGPLGPFQLAQILIGCRAGIWPRGFQVACWCDSEATAVVLRQRWGFNCRPGSVRLTRGYARISGTVAEDRRPLLEVSLINPEAISGTDIQFVASLHLARVPRDSIPQIRLAQVEPQYVVHQADRGRPVIERFEPEASTAGILPVYPISASFAICDITLPRVRYITDPDRPALRGTETWPSTTDTEPHSS